MKPIQIADDLARDILVVRVGDARAGACFSSDDVSASRCRFLLWRVWDPRRIVLVWCMLNPSKATHDVLDATVTRCIGWACRWGFGGVLVINAYAHRATNPKDMLSEPNRIGMGNDVAIETVLRRVSYEPMLCTCNGGSIDVDGGGVTCMTCKGTGWRSIHDQPQRVMVAWGDGIELQRSSDMKQLIHRVGASTHCLGRTRSGQPRHPVRLAYATPVEQWP